MSLSSPNYRVTSIFIYYILDALSVSRRSSRLLSLSIVLLLDSLLSKGKQELSNNICRFGMHCAYLHNNTSLQEKLSKIEKEQAETMKLVSKLQEEIIFLKSQTERFNNIFKNSSHFSSHPLLRERLWSSSPSKHSRNPSPPFQIRTSPSPARISDCEEESDVTLKITLLIPVKNLI